MVATEVVAEASAATGEAAEVVPTEVPEVVPSPEGDTPQTPQNPAVTAIMFTETKLSSV